MHLARGTHTTGQASNGDAESDAVHSRKRKSGPALRLAYGRTADQQNVGVPVAPDGILASAAL